TVLYKILNESPQPAHVVAPDIPEALSAIVMHAIEKDLDRRYPSMDAMRSDLQTVYRDLIGSSARFTTAPRLSQRYRPTGREIDPDATIATPNKGMLRPDNLTPDHITPPSGALARVPVPDDRTPTTARQRRREGGLELVNFRDPSQSAPDSRTGAYVVPRQRRKWLPLMLSIVIVAAAAGTALLLLTNKKQRPP